MYPTEKSNLFAQSTALGNNIAILYKMVEIKWGVARLVGVGEKGRRLRRK